MTDTITLTAVYAAVKLVAYSAWCLVGLRALRAAAAGLGSALALGAIRWLIGLGFGIVIFFAAGSMNAGDAARTYFLIYTPVRAVEWYLMARIVSHNVRRSWSSDAAVPLPLWCVGGMLVSFLSDLLSPDGVQGRFCIGRCLC